MRHVKIGCVGRAAGAAAGVWMAAAAAGQVTYTTVAMSGEAAPGTGGGVFDAWFGLPNIDDEGNLSFGAMLQAGPGGVDASNDGTVWIVRDGVLALVARDGWAAPIGDGVHFASVAPVEPPAVSAGSVTILSTVFNAPDPVGNIGIFVDSGGFLSAVAYEGGVAWGTGGARFNRVHQPAMNARGEVLFAASLRVGSGAPPDLNINNDSGLWLHAPAGSRLLAREGSEAPGTGGTTFGRFDMMSAVLNEAGEVAFHGGLKESDDVDESNWSALWASSGGVLRLIARTGSEAPGAGGARFGYNVGHSFTRPVLNASGDVAFRGHLVTGEHGVTGWSNGGIWARSGGVVELIAREGDMAPGQSLPFVLFGLPALNDAGDLTFTANVRRGDGLGATYEAGLWGVYDRDLRLIAGANTEAPGTGGAQFDYFWYPALNNAGDVAIRAVLQVGEHGVDSSNNSGVWVYRRAQNDMILLARRGDLFDVNDDPSVQDLRSVLDLGITSDLGLNLPWIRGRGLTDSGQIPVRLIFEDGSMGVFLASLPCACEFDGSGGVDVLDLLAYLDLWFAGDAGAEFDGAPAEVGVFDLLAYLDCWFGGCG